MHNRTWDREQDIELLLEQLRVPVGEDEVLEVSYGQLQQPWKLMLTTAMSSST